MPFTSQTTSEDIQTGLALHGSDGAFEIIVGNLMPTVFYNGADIYFTAGVTPLTGLYGISHLDSLPPEVFYLLEPTLVKAWYLRELQAWIQGTMQTSTLTWDDPTNTYTIEIGAGSWEGVNADETEALGLAFVELLNDPNFDDFLL